MFASTVLSLLERRDCYHTVGECGHDTPLPFSESYAIGDWSQPPCDLVDSVHGRGNPALILISEIGIQSEYQCSLVQNSSHCNGTFVNNRSRYLHPSVSCPRRENISTLEFHPFFPSPRHHCYHHPETDYAVSRLASGNRSLKLTPPKFPAR